MPEIGVYCSQQELQKEIEKMLEQLLNRFWPDYRLRRLPFDRQQPRRAEALSEACRELACLVFSSITREDTFALAETLWQQQPSLPVIFVAERMEDVFAALSYPFFHTVRAFALETDLQAAIRKLERLRPRLPAGHSFQCGTQIVRFFRKEILYLESDRHEIRIHLTKGMAETTEPLGQCEEKLKGAGFVRIHKSFLVNMYHIARLERDSLLMSNGERLYISRYRYGEVKLQFENYIRHLDFMS